jgi:hypothetical protein
METNSSPDADERLHAWLSFWAVTVGVVVIVAWPSVLRGWGTIVPLT